MCDQQGTDDWLQAWTARLELFTWRPPPSPQQPRQLCSAFPAACGAAVTRPRGEDSEPGLHPPRGGQPCIPWAAGSSRPQTVLSRHSYSTRPEAGERVSERGLWQKTPVLASVRVALPPGSRNETAFFVSFAVNATSSQILARGSSTSKPGRWKPPVLFSPLSRLKGGSPENLKESGVPSGSGLGPRVAA